VPPSAAAEEGASLLALLALAVEGALLPLAEEMSNSSGQSSSRTAKLLTVSVLFFTAITVLFFTFTAMPVPVETHNTRRKVLRPTMMLLRLLPNQSKYPS